MHIGTHRSNPARDDIVVVSICDYLDLFFPDWLTEMSWFDATTDHIVAFAEEFGGHIYSRPRESFCISEALDEAVSLGAKFVIVEDLS